MKHTELICRRGEIQEVVHKLEGDANIAAVLKGGFHSLRTRAGQHSYGLHRKTLQYKITKMTHLLHLYETKDRMTRLSHRY